MLGPKREQQLWPRPHQYKLFSSFCHSLGIVCWDLTRQHTKQGTKGRGSRCCHPSMVCVSPWQAAARPLNRLPGSDGVGTQCHFASSSPLSHSNLGRDQVSGSTKNTSSCCVLGCKAMGQPCRQRAGQRGEALQSPSNPPGKETSLFSCTATVVFEQRSFSR